VSNAAPVVMTEDFTAGTQHWTGLDTPTQVATGGESGAFLDVSRSVSSPFVDANRSSPFKITAGKFANDWVDVFGNSGEFDGLKISFYLKRTNAFGAGTTPRIYLFDNNTFSGAWEYHFAGEAICTDWTYYETTVSFDWTDAEAMAAGWTTFGTGVPTWADRVSTDLYSFRISHFDTEYAGGQERAFGLDTVRFESVVVPEPASVALMLVGTVAILSRKRRG